MNAASVVIPAFNEGRVIGRCLQALQDSGIPAEIIVAANGCQDDTVAVARRFSGVTVIDIPLPGKSNALTTGDAAASAFPRIYLDADIVLGPGALEGMIAALSGEEAKVAAPQVTFDTTGASWPVREYYRLYEQTPYVRSGLAGLGVYGISRAGRARFGDFPALQADDLFIQRLFRPDERVTSPGWVRVSTPRTLGNLLQVRTRVARGNAELAASSADLPPGDYSATTGSTLSAIARLALTRPRVLPGAVIYLGVVLAARLRARRSAPGTWNRDESTR